MSLINEVPLFFPVALNYQTPDKQNTLNRALFADNGGCGYIPKPDFLLDPDTAYSVTSPANLDREKHPRWTLNLQVKSMLLRPICCFKYRGAHCLGC